MRRVLVTGASGVIGKAISRELASRGFALTLQYRSQEGEVLRLIDEIHNSGGVAEALSFDVTDRQMTSSILEAHVAQHGAFYGVVYNVGVHRDGPMVALTGEDWDSVVSTNLTGVYNVLQPLLMPMIQAHDGGRIVTISSVAGITGNRGQANYAAAKAGVIALTKSLAAEMAKRTILVNCVAPGFIESEMIQDIPKEEIQRIVPLRRAGTPHEVAGVVGFLFSDAATYMTGQVLSPNGGLV
ncbi:MAG: 3-oxoacyl-ACP reductase FabG [Pseudomonadota bacterium]|jgi:3-oxoacyl-[acyl-carrier protein] reductase